MFCKDAIAGKVQTVSEDKTVEEALEILNGSNAEALPVVDADGNPVGLFSIQALLQNLLPVSVTMSEGIQLDVTVSAAPGISKRFKNTMMVPVLYIMERRIHVVAEEAPLWEGIHMLMLHKTPLLVMNAKTNKITGIMTFQSAFEELNRLKDTK